jgi:hypothetical protein
MLLPATGINYYACLFKIDSIVEGLLAIIRAARVDVKLTQQSGSGCST